MVLFAFNYKGVSYLLDISSDSIALSNIMDCEEENSESKKSSEKETDFLEDSIIPSLYSILYLKSGSSIQEPTLFFQTSDYSQQIDMPPEHTA